MGVSEAIKLHNDKLELMEDFSERDLANASQNPKYEQVCWWHVI